MEFCLLRHGQTVNLAYYVATAIGLKKARQGERPLQHDNVAASKMSVEQILYTWVRAP